MKKLLTLISSHSKTCQELSAEVKRILKAKGILAADGAKTVKNAPANDDMPRT
jgi:hypothetical protein